MIERERRSSLRPFLQVAPPMRRLNIVRMVVSPGPSHPFGINVVWHNIAVIGEFSAADGAPSVLLDYLPIQQFPHFCCGSEFPIPSGVVRVLNALHAKPYLSLFLPHGLPSTARTGSMERTTFIMTKSHSILLSDFDKTNGEQCSSQSGAGVALQWPPWKRRSGRNLLLRVQEHRDFDLHSTPPEILSDPLRQEQPAIAIRKARLGDGRAILACLKKAFAEYRDSYTRDAFVDTVLTPETLGRRLATMCVFVAVNDAGAQSFQTRLHAFGDVRHTTCDVGFRPAPCSSCGRDQR
jgi:hypothetical protein